MRVVSNKELSSYKVLPFDIYTENKGKIMDAGEVLTPGKLILLKNYVKIYTEEFNNDSSLADSNSNSLKKSEAKFLNYTYDGLDASEFETVLNKDSYINSETQIKIKYFYQRTLDILKRGFYEEGLLKLNTLVNVMKTEIFKPIGKFGQGSKMRFLGEYELCHPLNVAIVSGLIAKKLDYSELATDQVILGALIHDIGKLKIELPDSQATLTMNEDEVKTHPILGYNLIKKEFELPDAIAKIALEHHENNDGSGYPQGLSSDYISEYAQIINVANYYDNSAFNRTPVQVINNKEALRAMLEVGTNKFSAKILYSFIHMFNYDDSKDFKDMMI